jgi:Family of unknown function (DUF6951)
MANQKAKAEINSGKCGFQTSVDARSVDDKCELTILSDCESVRRLAENLTEVDPFREISYRGEGLLTLKKAAEYRLHPACPVPAGIIKTIEVACGLSLPVDVHIKISK